MLVAVRMQICRNAPTHPIEILAKIDHALGIHPKTIDYNRLNQPREKVKAHAVTGLIGPGPFGCETSALF
jgi:hypothetical protein